MKIKHVFILMAASVFLTGCHSSNLASENPRLAKPSTYSLSIYATERANINLYSENDDMVFIISDEADMPFNSEEFDATTEQGNKKLGLNNDSYGKNVRAASSIGQKTVITQEINKADYRATPVMLKVFQLTDKSLFLSTAYDDFRSNSFDESLGKTYISNIDLIIAPNQFRFVATETLDEKAHYIGVVALYNDYENRKWKGIVQVNPKGGDSYPLLIRVLDSKVEIHKDS